MFEMPSNESVEREGCLDVFNQFSPVRYRDADTM